MVTTELDCTRLKVYRKEGGFSQKALADRTGVSPRYIRELENGSKNNPSAELLKRISMVLNVSQDVLFKGTGEEGEDVHSASSVKWKDCECRQKCPCRYAQTPTPCFLRGQCFVKSEKEPLE